MLRWPFFSIGEWELGCQGRVAGGGCADSILQFQLERGDDGINRCWKMKWRQ
jgi:hypothetical protein